MGRRRAAAFVWAAAVLLLLFPPARSSEVAEYFPVHEEVLEKEIPPERLHVVYVCDWVELPDEEGDVAVFSEEYGISDPVEGVNRVVFSASDAVMIYFVRPVGVGYCTVMPRPVMRGISNIGKNIEWPGRASSCMMQGDFADAGEETLRFFTNTTLGVGGIFDPATDWFGLEMHDEDFGQAFASWGVGSGPYLFLPVKGPSSLRDGVGAIFDTVLDAKTYVPYGGSWLFRLNEATRNYHLYEQLRESNADPYDIMKDMWYIKRQVDIEK